MQNFKNHFFLLIFALLSIWAGGFLIFELKKFGAEIDRIFLAQIDTSFKNESEPIRLFFVGDIMLDRGVEFMVKKYGNSDWQFPFFESANYLKEADILFGNLESVISDKGYKVGSIYSFRAEPSAIEGLKYAGFDILSVANNHIFDYGREAMEDSFKWLKNAGIDYVGGGFSKNEACSPIIKEAGAIKIAFLAFTNLGSKLWEAGDNHSGICWLDENMKDYVQKAKKDSDLIVVSIHWGEEYQAEPSKEQKYFGYLAVDAGADLVIGHHPHIIQPIEECPLFTHSKESYIAYSLGNFVFDQGFSEETMRGLTLEILIEDKTIKKIIPKEIMINKFFQPALIKEL